MLSSFSCSSPQYGNNLPHARTIQLETLGQAVPEDGGTISDPELLMEVMEQREMVEETDDAATLQTMLAENKLLEKATTEVLAAVIAACFCYACSHLSY